MDRENIVRLIKLLGGSVPPLQKRKGYVVAGCPLAPWRHSGGRDRHPSFAIKIKPSGLSRYNCFTCGADGLMGLVTQVAALNKERQEVDADISKALHLVAYEEENAELDIPDFDETEEPMYTTVAWPETYLDQFVPVTKYAKPMAYLLSRGFEASFLKTQELLYDKFRKRILFVLRDWKGQLVGCHSRTIIAGVTPPYLAYKCDAKEPTNPFTEAGSWNALPWLGENNVDPEEPVVLAEGPMDWLSVRRVYGNVLCGLSVGLAAEKIKRLHNIMEFVTLYDVGTGGDSARARLDKYLPGSLMQHVMPLEEYGDAGAMPKVAVKYLLEDYLAL